MNADNPTDGHDCPMVPVVAGGVEDAALVVFYQRCAGPIYSLAFHMLQDPAAAEELLHAVLSRCWRAAEQPDAPGCNLAWLLNLTQRGAVERLRLIRQQRPPAVGPPAFDWPALSAEAPPAAAGLADQTHQLAQQTLADLPLVQRQALALAYAQGCSPYEIASLLGVPVGMVVLRIRCAMQALKASLGGADA